MRKKRVLTEEHKKKLSEVRKGKKRKFSEQAIENIRKAAAKRRGVPTGPCSDRRRLAISLAKKGIPIPEERKKRISQTLKGRSNPILQNIMKKKRESGDFKSPWHKMSEKRKREIIEKISKKLRIGKGRNSFISKEWIKKVKNRDRNKCQKCFSKEKLHAHHIVDWNDNESKRFDLDNGMTLCNSCHSRITRNGKKHTEDTKNKIRKTKKDFFLSLKGNLTVI